MAVASPFLAEQPWRHFSPPQQAAEFLSLLRVHDWASLLLQQDVFPFSFPAQHFDSLASGADMSWCAQQEGPSLVSAEAIFSQHGQASFSAVALPCCGLEGVI